MIKPVRIVRRKNPGTFRIEKRHVKNSFNSHGKIKTLKSQNTLKRREHPEAAALSFFITQWGNFDRYGLVGEEYQHKRLKLKEGHTDRERKSGGKE